MNFFRLRALLFSALLSGVTFASGTSAFAQSSAGLHGRAVDADGRPVRNAVVQLVSDQTTHGGHAWRYTLVGDSLGKFGQEGLAPGAYLVMLFTDGKGTDILRSVQLKAGDTQMVDLKLGSPVQMAGNSGLSMDARRRTPTLTR